MGLLIVDCKACGKAFPSPIQMDQGAFVDPTNQLIGNSYQCPHCGTSSVYDKPDHRFVADPSAGQ